MSEKVILKSIGGFYYVKSGDEVIECKAKGKFRNLSLSPVAGDIVDTEFDGSTNVITKIYPRKNKFIRPPFANLDLLVLVISTVDPAPNYLVIDKMCAIAENKDVQVIMVITKTDMAEYENIRSVYAKAGFKVFYTGADDDGQLEEIRREMQGKLCVFSGNSGRVEIFETDGCMVADTPGFSSVELVDDNFISKDDLQYAFVEFAPYLGSCKFADCRHINEIGCAVKGAVDGGEIPQSRYESYKALYDRQKNIKEWEL